MKQNKILIPNRHCDSSSQQFSKVTQSSVHWQTKRGLYSRGQDSSNVKHDPSMQINGHSSQVVTPSGSH